MKKYIEHGPDLSFLSEWKNCNRADRRAALKRFGHALARSGLVKQGALVSKDNAHKLVELINSRVMFSVALRELKRQFFGDDVMQAREKCLNKYKPVAWADQLFFRQSGYSFTHVLHVSEVDAEQIAFAPTLDKLVAGKFTRMRPGKYLTRYFSDVLDAGTIKCYAEEYAGEHCTLPLKWATTQEEMVRVVNFGPSESCMSAAYNSGREEWYAGPEHPAAAYAAGDIHIAYLEHNCHVLARCICNITNKRAARAYGDASRLLPLLDAAGYRQTPGALIGCRLLKIETDAGKYVMPYVDAGTGSGGGALSYKGEGRYFILTDSGRNDGCTSEGNSNSGVTDDDNRCYCGICGGRIGEDEQNYVEYTDQSVCESCLNDNFVYAYGWRHQEYYPEDECVYCRSNDEWYFKGTLEHHNIAECTIRNKWYALDDLVYVTSQKGNVHVDEAVHLDVDDGEGNSYALENEVVEDRQGRTVLKDDCTCIDGVWWHKDDVNEELEPGLVSTDTKIEEVTA